MARKLKLTVAYDGSRYHGFQRQANAVTIQEVLEEQLAKIFGHRLKLNGAARTDAGVHAYNQVITFDTEGKIPVDKVSIAAQGVLPDDIVVTGAEEVSCDFHACHSARSKIYLYQVYVSKVSDPFRRNYAWHLKKMPNVVEMHKVAQRIVGEHDFSAFRASGGHPINPVRTMLAAECRQDDEKIELMFHGTGFLYHMVRNLVGTLIDVGWGRLTDIEFAAILTGRDRSLAGITAPPQGLYLKEVFY
jgi:tRNA pseudouridine38-40 synthase